MFSGPRRAYDSGSRTSASGRELEAAALSRAARQIEQCQQSWEEPGLEDRLGQALRHNQRLWTFFQGEWVSPACTLPRDLRANLLALSRFVDKRTFAQIGEPNREGLQALIDINRQLADGLSVRASETAVTPA